ncbi:hypothetical protein LOD99_8989 [Oopsacas minuta]|uniref:RING-type E3 ubiquitin transferase n=1 Tax=Oopsacas minuta TaxID=111878 RepID=A0AAV7JE63_9METZ|nr:hypothetical protein LOD99_8989 [Oopsacas minuta]
MASRQCKNSPDSFCYVCGYYVGDKHVSNKISKEAKYWEAYRLYFGMSIGDQEKAWAPHVICGSCRSNLEAWLRGFARVMPFAIPRVWREPQNHHDDCYFCMVNIAKYRKVKGRRALTYPSIPSSIAPIPHSETLPVPKPPANLEFNTECEDSMSSETSDAEEEYLQSTSADRHYPSKRELDDLIRDLQLTKSAVELLTSRLSEWNLLRDDCKITAYRKRHLDYSVYFDVIQDLCYCKDVNGLFDAVGIEHDPSQWRLFIDSSTKSLKRVLLHNGNKYPSIPLAYSIQMKEDYENVKQLLLKINYAEFNWQLCGDFKMLGFLLGLQGGYTKYSCFLCLWNSRADGEHYSKIQWSPRKELMPGKYNVIKEPLVCREKVLLPPLHIKLGLVKQFVKALDFEGEAFQEIRAMFPKLSDAKLKGGIFVGPQITTMLKSRTLEGKMTETERKAWQAFRDVVSGFLGNNKDPNYEEIVNTLITSYQKMGCRMSLKLHFLCSHLDLFQENLGDFSEEHGERFHQDIQLVERLYQGRWDSAMMGDYMWFLIREDISGHKRKARLTVHF